MQMILRAGMTAQRVKYHQASCADLALMHPLSMFIAVLQLTSTTEETAARALELQEEVYAAHICTCSRTCRVPWSV